VDFKIAWTEWVEIPRTLLEWRVGRAGKPSKRDINHVLNDFFDRHGVYLLAEFAPDAVPREVVALADDPIIYVGKAGLQTFYKRWTNTHEAWKRLGEKHKKNDSLMQFFFSLAAIESQEATAQVWSEVIRVRVDHIYIEQLEQAVRQLLREKNRYYRDNNIGS
jgi:hypothetical protein